MKSGRKSSKDSSKKSEKVSLPDHYNSLDTPIYIWGKVHEKGDVTWLLVKRKKVSDKVTVKLSLVFEDIYNQYLAKFGVSESYANEIRKTREIISLRYKMHVTGDRTIKTFIELAEEELKDMKSSMGKADLIKTKISVEKSLGFQINMHTTSIDEFYSYLKN